MWSLCQAVSFVSPLEQNLLELLESFVLFFCRNIIYMMTYYQICSWILSARKSDGRFERLFVKKDSTSTESSSQLFVDTAVYTRNRCFRFALSSKAGINLCFFLQGDSNIRTWYGIFLLKNNFLMYILKLSNIILSLHYFFL